MRGITEILLHRMQARPASPRKIHETNATKVYSWLMSA